MTNARAFDQQATYEIRIKGRLDARWSRWFGGMALVPQPGGDCLLVGPVADQAALYGMFSRMRDMGLVLVSVYRREADHPDDSPDREPPKPALREDPSGCDKTPRIEGLETSKLEDGSATRKGIGACVS
jgi:hypothetical protein